MSDVVRLRVGGVVFEAEKESLLRFDHTFFHGLFSSGRWLPEADGAYFIDRPAMGFNRVLDYLRSGKLSVNGLSELEENCMYSSLDYLLIPYKRQWKYDTSSVIEGLTAWYVYELKDGRLCCTYENDISVWNTDKNAIEMTMKGHTYNIRQLIQLQDGRVCSCSDDETIKLWNIDSGLCEHTLTDHTDCIYCIIQLFDGRICSGSYDKTIRVWNISTGLDDGRICCGDTDGGCISVYSLLTGECELLWEGHTHWVSAIACIDATRVCSGAADSTIKIWSTATGECERSLEGHINRVISIVLMQDGRLCSGSYDGILKLWNPETGECEKTLDTNNSGCRQVLQLEDGRLLCTCRSGAVVVWS